MSGAAAGVDVDTIRSIVDDIGLGAQGIKYRTADHPGAAVSAVQTDLMLLIGLGGQADQITDVTVSAGIVVYSLTDLIFRSERQFFQLAVDVLLDLILQIVIHLLAFEIHQLDTVIVIRVVAGGDHDTTVEILGACDVADARSCGDMQ